MRAYLEFTEAFDTLLRSAGLQPADVADRLRDHHPAAFEVNANLWVQMLNF